MLLQPLIQQLHDLRLRGMAASVEQQNQNAERGTLTFEERLGLMIQHEAAERASARLAQRLRWARLPQGAVMEDLDTQTLRGLSASTLAQVRDLGWIAQHLNVLITGPTGVGKSFLACALAHAACRMDHAVRFFRLPRLVDELTRYHALQNRWRLYGPNTWFDTPSGQAPVHVDAAADAARRAMTLGRPGVYNVAEDDETVTCTKAHTELGWSASFRARA